MTRQRRWQLKKRAEGKCIVCGVDSNGKILCRKHAIQVYRSKAKQKRIQRLRAEGKCPKHNLPYPCPKCREISQRPKNVLKARLRSRIKTNSNPWRPGGPGRPPKIFDPET
jgi:hypothetical protein